VGRNYLLPSLLILARKCQCALCAMAASMHICALAITTLACLSQVSSGVKAVLLPSAIAGEMQTETAVVEVAATSHLLRSEPRSRHEVVTVVDLERSSSKSLVGVESPKVDLGWAPCDWQKPTKDHTMHCVDGTYCNPHAEQWTCCATHGGRLQCPNSLPKMCNKRDCGGNDHCCASTCELFDGDKACHIEHKIYGMDRGWLTFPTRDEHGDPVSEWTDLVSGPMTWELWYARRPNVVGNTNEGNAIMSTYADNHNTNAFSAHNRRRNIGVYIQPDTGRLSLGAFVGESSKVDPDPKDPLAGAHTMLGPAITDQNWHHIAVVWSRAEGRAWLYVDGKKHTESVRYEPGEDNPGLDGKLVIGGGHLGRTTTCKVSQFRLWKLGLRRKT